MTAIDPPPGRPSRTPHLFAAVVFAGAGLVFLVEPMIARLVLPAMGGSPAVWNTSLAFFQIALLAGYAYAHLLQRLRGLSAQIVVHLALLTAAALALPLRISDSLGPPSTSHPAAWLVAVLALSVGAPFAMLSATAPLLQAWHARVFGQATGKEPYSLYAASNLGSLLALLAYPLLVEPGLTLHAQTLDWSLGYGAFVALIAVAGIVTWRRGVADPPPARLAGGGATSWRTRLAWVALAAVPSSLMLGVTAHITTDIASAPFLWVAPLALYLITFILAFQDRPAFSPRLALPLQAAALVLCVALTPARTFNLPAQLATHLLAFFLTALVCHQALVARRPPPERLTEFYLWMALGGVIGGGFNAFLAPVIFNNVWEYPVVMALSAFARPWGAGRPPRWGWLCLIASGASAVAAVIAKGAHAPDSAATALLGAAMAGAFLVRDRSPLFFGALAMLAVSSFAIADRTDVQHSWRSFFGVMRELRTRTPELGGEVRMLAHGTTLHGAQALAPRLKCLPLVYYAPSGAIGEVFLRQLAGRSAARIGAVGLGTGAVAAYTRPGDRLTFFEIDPLVVRLSTTERRFTYATDCARGAVDYVLGDARLTMARQPRDAYDILLIDAFSSDSVPAHLLTVEAVRGYLTHLKPDGVLILHLSNRNLDLPGAAQAVSAAAGGGGLIQRHHKPANRSLLRESDEDVLIMGRSPQAVAAYAADPAWRPVNPRGIRPWTDDYTNIFGALVRRLEHRWREPGD